MTPTSWISSEGVWCEFVGVSLPLSFLLNTVLSHVFAGESLGLGDGYKRNNKCWLESFRVHEMISYPTGLSPSCVIGRADNLLRFEIWGAGAGAEAWRDEVTCPGLQCVGSLPSWPQWVCLAVRRRKVLNVFCLVNWTQSLPCPWNCLHTHRCMVSGLLPVPQLFRA